MPLKNMQTAPASVPDLASYPFFKEGWLTLASGNTLSIV